MTETMMETMMEMDSEESVIIETARTGLGQVISRRDVSTLRHAGMRSLDTDGNECPMARASRSNVGVSCVHGYDVCPTCDPCTCERC